MKVRIPGQAEEWEIRFERGTIAFLAPGTTEASPTWVLESSAGTVHRIGARGIDAKDLELRLTPILGAPASAEVIKEFDPAPITDPASGGSYLWPRRKPAEAKLGAVNKPRKRARKKRPRRKGGAHGAG